MKKVIFTLATLVTITTTMFSQTTVNPTNSSTKKFIFTAEYGLGIRTAKAPSNLDPIVENYIKDLRKGNSFTFKANYKSNSNSMYGIMYSTYNSKASLNNVSFDEPNGIKGQGRISDNITISFIGIGGGFYGKGFQENDAVILDIYIGYIGYKNEAKLTNNYTITGSNLGISSSLSYYIGISPALKIGPSISFNGGVLNKFNIEGDNGFKKVYKLDKDTLESLYRFDLSIGLLLSF